MTRGRAREVAVRGLRKAALLAAALLLALAFGVRDAAAQAITFDSASNSVGLNVSSLTWSHTVGAGSGRIVVVGVSIRGNSTVTGVTYAGQALTVVGTVSNGGSNHVEMWALVAPPAGTANVVVSLSSSAHVVGGAVVPQCESDHALRTVRLDHQQHQSHHPGRDERGRRGRHRHRGHER